jgi:hypothetical protein
MRYSVGVDEALGPVTLAQMTERLRAAADSGFATAWWAQLFNWDALTAIAVAGSQVPGIALGTAVVPTYPRHPLMLASQALSVQAAVERELQRYADAGTTEIVAYAVGSAEEQARTFDLLAALARDSHLVRDA